MLSRRPHEWLQPQIKRQGVVEGVHHVDVLVEEHVTLGEASRHLPHPRQLLCVFLILLLPVHHLGGDLCQGRVRLTDPHDSIKNSGAGQQLLGGTFCLKNVVIATL